MNISTNSSETTDIATATESIASVAAKAQYQTVEVTKVKTNAKVRERGLEDLATAVAMQLCAGLEAFAGGGDDEGMRGVLSLLTRIGKSGLEDMGVASDDVSARTFFAWYDRSPEMLNEVVSWSGPDFPVDARFVDFESARRAALAKLNSTSDKRRWASGFLEVAWVILQSELDGNADREQLTDTLLMGMRRVRDAGREEEALISFLGVTYRMLAENPDQRGRPSLGIIQSLTSIGDAAGRSRKPRLLRFAVATYLRTLGLLSTHYSSGGEDLSGIWRRVQGLTNNISGRLSTLGGFDAGVRDGFQGDQKRIAQLMNRVQVLNCMGEALTHATQVSNEELWTGFGFDLKVLQPAEQDEVKANWLGWLEAVVRAMNNVLSSWAYPAPDVFKDLKSEFLGEDARLVIAAFGALVRADYADRTGDDKGDPGSSFFNAGLSINRMFKQFVFGNADGEWLEVICYALGAGWAISRAKDVGEAINSHHAGSCFVNMAGALTRVPKRGLIKQAFKALVGQIVAAQANGDFGGNDAFRFENSVREIFGEDGLKEFKFQARDTRLDPQKMLEALRDLLESSQTCAVEAFGSDSVLPEISPGIWGEDKFFSLTLGLMKMVVESTLKSSQSAEQREEQSLGFLESIERVQSLLKQMVPLIHSHRAQIRTLNQVSEQFKELDTDTASYTFPETQKLPSSYEDWFCQSGVFRWVPKVQLVTATD